MSDDGICPFMQKECIYANCMLFNSNLESCVFEETASRLELIEKELKVINSKIESIGS